MTRSPPDTSMPHEETRANTDKIRARIGEIREELQTLDSQIEKLEEENRTRPDFERSRIEFEARARRRDLLEELGLKTEELHRLEKELERLSPERSPGENEMPSPQRPNTPEIPDKNDAAGNNDAISAEARVFLDEMTKPGRLIDDILLKRPEDLTEGEFLALKKATLELPQGPERDRLDAMATKFLDATYGTEPLQRDAVGRLVEPKPAAACAKRSPASAHPRWRKGWRSVAFMLSPLAGMTQMPATR